MIQFVVLALIVIFLALPFVVRSVKKSPPPQYLLKNIDTTVNKDLRDFGMKKNPGKVLVASPPDQRTNIDYTSKLGKGINAYYGFSFQVPKWDYNIVKFDETMDVSSVYQQYYQLTKSHKESLEGKIKSGLADVAKSVGDYELVKHDLRRYEDLKKQFDTGDEHSLKSLFVDQVDYHAGSVGQGPGRLSMAFMRQNNIMPTIVQDFMQMESEEDLDKGRFKALPSVEKDMLKTKWRAYQRWKDMFRHEVYERYESLKQLAATRKSSIDEYKEWLKPLMAEHKLIKGSMSDPNIRKQKVTSFVHGAGVGTSAYAITLWVWKPIRVEEFYLAPGEIYAKKPVRPDDGWTRKELIFNKHHGLIAEFPWITEDWVNEKIKEIKGSAFLPENEHYHSFFEVVFDNTIFRFADGSDLDDMDITISAHLISQNALLVKLLELKAREEDLERYINKMMGVPNKNSKVVEYEKKFHKYVVKKIDNKKPEKKTEFRNLDKMKKKFEGGAVFVDVTKKRENPVSKILDFYGMNFKIFRKGPYDAAFKDRVWKFYAKQMGAMRTGQLIGHLKTLTNIGK